MTAQELTIDHARSPWIVGLALAIGLLAQAFAGPIAGIVGAAVGAGAGRAVIHFTDDQAEK